MDHCENNQTVKAETGVEKIFVFTQFGKRLLKFCITLLPLLIAISVLIFHWQMLLENPFSTQLKWQAPTIVYRNVNGNMVVVDRLGERIVILDEYGKIRALLHANFFSQRTITNVEDIDVDDRYIYVLDLQHSANGAQVNGERILVYDLNGKYVDTPYEIYHPDAKQRNPFFCDISCYNGRVFVSRRDQENVTIYQVKKHDLVPVRKLNFPGKEIFRTTFMADIRSTYVITRDACFYLNYHNRTEQISMPDSQAHWNDVCISPSGDRFYLDSNRREIVQVRPNMKKKELLSFGPSDEIKKITDVYALRFSLEDDVLAWCAPISDQITTLNVITGKRTVSTHVSLPVKTLLFRGFVWLCAIFLAFVLIKNIISVIQKIVRSFRHLQSSDENGDAGTARNSLNFWKLYGKNIFTLTFAFLAVTGIISFFYAGKMLGIMEASVRSTAAKLSNMPGEAFGDYLGKIDSPSDYNTNAFRTLRKVGSSICFSNEGSFFDQRLSVFRRLPNGDYMYVIDTLERFCIGKILTRNDPGSAELRETIQRVENEKLFSVGESKFTGSSIFYAFAPIYDSDHQQVGAVQISCSRARVYAETLAMIAKLSVDLLLIFIIFVLVSGEIKLILAFRRRRKCDPATGELLHTVCEGHRPCQFLMSTSLFLDAAFLPTLAMELARRSALTSNPDLLAAIPIAARNLMLVVALVAGELLAKYNPGKLLKSGATFSILCYGCQIYAVLTGSYFALLLGIAALGVMHGVKINALDAIGASGLQPDEKFKNVVFVNTEFLIGAAVGTSIGSLLCAKAGYVTAFAFGVGIEIAEFLVTRMFITNDINLQCDQSAIRGLRSKIHLNLKDIKINARHFCSPEILTLLFCVMVPICALDQFDTTVLPLYNAWAGYSQLLTGFIGTVTKVLALLLIPYCFKRCAAYGNRMPVLVGMLLIVAGFFFFAFDTTPLTLGLLLLVITTFYIVFVTTSERLRIAAAERDGINYNDVAGAFHAFEYLGSAVAPLLFSVCIKLGFTVFSIVFGVLTAILLFVFFIFSARLRRASLGKCL